MSKRTIIAWTERTFNIAWGCAKISPGCAHCYADFLSRQYGQKNIWGKNANRRTFGGKYWAEPLKWNREAFERGKKIMVFSSSMCDIFEDHPTIQKELQKLFPLIKATPNLIWQLLTKRPERIASSLPQDWGNGYPNVWLGTSIENNNYVWRAEHLRAVPAVVRFVSYEPALGALDKLDLSGIDWLIYGGESGPRFRQHNVQWARDIRRRCEENGTAFFYKQSPAVRTEMGIELDGKIVRNFPPFDYTVGKQVEALRLFA